MLLIIIRHDRTPGVQDRIIAFGGDSINRTGDQEMGWLETRRWALNVGDSCMIQEISHVCNCTSLPLIQEGQLSVSGERMCTILVKDLED